MDNTVTQHWTQDKERWQTKLKIQHRKLKRWAPPTSPKNRGWNHVLWWVISSCFYDILHVNHIGRSSKNLLWLDMKRTVYLIYIKKNQSKHTIQKLISTGINFHYLAIRIGSWLIFNSYFHSSKVLNLNFVVHWRFFFGSLTLVTKIQKY